MKFGKLVPQGAVHRTTSRILDMTSYLQDGGHDVISRKAWSLPRVWRHWLAVCALQYLIHSPIRTFFSIKRKHDQQIDIIEYDL